MKKTIFILVAFASISVNSLAQRPTISANETLSTNVSDDNQGETYEVVNAASVNVRSAASTSSRIVGKLKKGERITVLNISNGWARCVSNGKEVFVSSRYLKKIETEGPLDESQVADDNTIQTINVTEANEEIPMQTDVMTVNQEAKTEGLTCLGAIFMVNDNVKQLGIIAGARCPDDFGFEMRSRFFLQKSLTCLMDFMPNYTFSLVKKPDLSNSLFLVTSVGANIGLYEYGDKTKFTYGLVFSPTLLYRFDKIAIGAGYNMDVTKFKFKKESLLHSFCVSLCYSMPW